MGDLGIIYTTVRTTTLFMNVLGLLAIKVAQTPAKGPRTMSQL